MNEALSQWRQVATESPPPGLSKPWTRLLLMVPVGPQSISELRDLGLAIAYRFEGQWEHSLEYVNKANDRLLNQARSLLTFEGLVLTALGAVYPQTHRIPASLLLVGSVCAVVAAGILLLTQFSSSFGDLSKYQNAECEFLSSVTRVVINAKSNAVVKLFSLVALFCLVTAFGILVLRDHPY